MSFSDQNQQQRVHRISKYLRAMADSPEYGSYLPPPLLLQCLPEDADAEVPPEDAIGNDEESDSAGAKGIPSAPAER